MLATAHEWQILIAIVGASGVVLAAVLPVLLRVNRHARGAYDAVNRVDEIVEPGGPDAKAPNLRQLVVNIDRTMVRGFTEAAKDRALLHERVGEVRSEARLAHDAAREAFEKVEEHAKDEMSHPWLKRSN